MSWMMYDTVDLLVMEVMSCHVMSCHDVMSCRHCHCIVIVVSSQSPLQKEVERNKKETGETTKEIPVVEIFLKTAESQRID